MITTWICYTNIIPGSGRGSTGLGVKVDGILIADVVGTRVSNFLDIFNGFEEDGRILDCDGLGSFCGDGVKERGDFIF